MFFYIDKLLKRKQKKLVNFLYIFTLYSINTIKDSIINLVFTLTNLTNKITNWYINKKANIKSNYKIIRYKIIINKQ